MIAIGKLSASTLNTIITFLNVGSAQESRSKVASMTAEEAFEAWCEGEGLGGSFAEKIRLTWEEIKGASK